MKKMIIIIATMIVIIGLVFGVMHIVNKNNMPEDLTEKTPTISGESIVESVEKDRTTASIKVKENETVVIDLLDGWKYEVSEELSDRYEYAVSFISDSNNKMTLYEYKNMFGVCGTGLKVKDITLDDENVVGVGFYDNNECWYFVNFKDNLAMINEGLTFEESNEALDMIKTIKFVKTFPGNISEN